MASKRYNFNIKSKIKMGRMQDKPFFVGYFAEDDNDAAAIAFAAAVQAKLGNKAAIGITKSVQEVTEADVELPASYAAQDTYDVSIVYNNSTNQSSRYFQLIPGVKDGEQDAIAATLAALETLKNENDVLMDRAYTSKHSGKNVVTGGTVS